MVIIQVLLFLTTILLIFPLLAVQWQNLIASSQLSECCICRRTISKNEEIVVCPNCQTIYHRTHLSLWLKIRKKCPICKNIIKNRYLQSYFGIKDPDSSINIDISKKGVISCQRKHSNSKNSIALECPYCKNILESSVIGVLTQCKICGSYISWAGDFESRIKNLDEPFLYKSNKIKKTRFSRNNEHTDKINYRNIKRQKEKNREIFRKELQKQTLLESQDQMFLLNQDYLRRQLQVPNYKQDLSLREREKINPKETNFLKLNIFKLVITAIIVLILIFMLM
ncbi:MAG: RING finger protein [Promethearchaeota archaeon]